MDNTERIKLENLETYLHNLTPLPIFEKFFFSEVYQLIVDKTVRYATTQKNKPRFTVSFEEIQIFIGFLLFGGYHTLSKKKGLMGQEEEFRSGHRSQRI